MLLVLVFLLGGGACFLALHANEKTTSHVTRFALKVRAYKFLEHIGQSRVIFELSERLKWKASAKALMRTLGEHEIVLTYNQTIGCIVVALVLLGLFVAWVAQSWLAFVFAMPVLFVAPYFAGNYVISEQQKRVQKTLPDAYRSLAGSLSSGQSLPQAIAYVGRHVPGKVGEAFQEASFSFATGGSLEESFAIIERHLHDSSCELLICALAVSQQTGAPLAHLLNQAATLVEEKFQLAKTLQTKTAQAKMSVQVVIVLPIVLVAGLALISPDFQAGLASPLGICSLFIAAVMDISAIVVMKKILRRVELSC